MIFPLARRCLALLIASKNRICCAMTLTIVCLSPKADCVSDALLVPETSSGSAMLSLLSSSLDESRYSLGAWRLAELEERGSKNRVIDIETSAGCLQ